MNPTSRQRRLLVAAGAASALLAAAGCASRPSSSTVAALAPTGRLRASINLGNPILARRDPATGAGGRRVGRPRPRARRASSACRSSWSSSTPPPSRSRRSTAAQADIGFFAIDPLRSDGIRFTAPYVLIEGAYLVRNDSPLTDNDEVDRAGTRVMVGKGSAYDLYLTRELKAAQLVRAPTSPAVVDEFLTQRADVAAGVKQQLEADAARARRRCACCPAASW